MTKTAAPVINLLDPASFDGGHPVEQYQWLREHAPVHRHAEPDGPGFWAVTRHDLVRQIGRDPKRFSSEPTISIADGPTGSMFGDDHKMMLMMDPPRHTDFRKLISREFTQGPAAALRPRIQKLASDIVDAVAAAGECDFVAQVAGEMPSIVIADLMGLPLDDGRKLYELTEIIHTAPETLPEGAQLAAITDMFAYARDVIADKRARPGNDLATQILQAEVDGQRLDDIDFQLFFMLLIDAGGDTTRNLVGAGLLALLDHPEQLARLRADPDALLTDGRNELLRWVSPVIHFRRTATEDTVLGDQQIRAGDKVVMYYGAANRDPEVFDQPERFDITRQHNPHLAFGHGTHVCLGQHIARIEIDCLLREVLARMHDIRLAEPPQWLASNFISGPRRMPITFTT